jgi:uncharacterized protein
MIVRIHRSDDRIVMTIVDENIIGKVFTEGNRQLDLSSNFYKGERKTEEQIEEMIQDVYIIHVVGEESVSLLKRKNLLGDNGVIRISNVPHAEIVLVQDS